ncbi:ergothioneine biosynthesis protein EgtB [Aromatoleum sp.]|uniref:ergothioneine biosynthesis protein EgtB n=1 Tax=Aromatoleum sp. TaxID=2307007 RepID=UPI002FC8949D
MQRAHSDESITAGEPATLGAWRAGYRRVRADSEALCAPLAVEDYVIQTTAEASPAKWHLAHVSWFFETFILRAFLPGYREFDTSFRVLFNSYYEQVGAFHPRDARGFLSRPTVDEVFRYRAHVDRHIEALLDGAGERPWAQILERLGIGLNHEQQHQELLLTDIKRNFSVNPLRPAYRPDLPERPAASVAPLEWLDFDGGLVENGKAGGGFAYDNERPRHRVWLEPFRLASRPVTNGEFLAFIDAGGYSNPALWLSDGWARVRQSAWYAPLYWERLDGDWWRFTLGGMRRVDRGEPVCHVSHYEADAFATWSGRRLPTEAEWEHAAADRPIDGNLRDRGYLEPAAAAGPGEGLRQLYGDVWEHTASAYLPYPGFRTADGALGEYNGKFMSGQMVLRGGSCVTPADHIRPSYRNFFYPHERWQFQGLRLAADAD